MPSKYIQEPGMHRWTCYLLFCLTGLICPSVTAASLHPSGDFIAGQSMDNSIVVYAVGERVCHTNCHS